MSVPKEAVAVEDQEVAEASTLVGPDFQDHPHLVDIHPTEAQLLAGKQIRTSLAVELEDVDMVVDVP